MNHLLQDLRIALRGLLRTPSFTATAVLILAVGIGMAVAMFTVFDAVLVRNLPVRDQDRIVELFTYRGDPKADYYLLREDLPKVAASSRTMRDIAGIAHWGAPEFPMLDGDRALVINRTLVTGNFFDVLGTRAVVGRLIRPADELPGAPAVLVISYGIWQKDFGGDSAIVGRSLTEPYGNKRYEVIGVAPPGLDYPAGVGIWMPAWLPSETMSSIAIARLAPGASPRAAQSEFFGTMKTLYPDRKFEGVHVQTFTNAVVGNVRPVLVTLASAVGLLLLIACVNVGNLLLLRAAGRARELSIRRALGASYMDIIRQLLVESTLLGVAGGVAGLLVTMALIKILLTYAPPQLPRTDVIGPSGLSAAIAIGTTLIAVLFFGVFPAVIASRGALAAPLRFDARAGSETRSRRNVRQLLVAAQLTLALVMLAGAGLLGRSLERLQGISLGYDSERLSLLTFSYPPSEYNDAAGKFVQEKVYVLGSRLLPALRAVPGVVSITPALVPPFLGANIYVGRLDMEGQTPDEMKSNPVVPVEVGGADYFKTFGIPVRHGRAFTDNDDERAPLVAIVSEAVARRVWPNEDPIGKRVHYWSADSTAWRTVVGVAGDIHWRSLRESTPSVYIPWRQAPWQGAFAIRTSGDLSTVVPGLRRATHEVNPVLTLWNAKPMDALLAQPLAQPRLGALLLTWFAVVSMLLAAIGLYGVMSSAVRSSTRELGVRAALGASPERLRRGVLRNALQVAGVGVGAGLIAALATTRLLSSLLYEVSPTDPIALLGPAALLSFVALIAAYIPAHRATKIDPVEALRAE